MPAASTLCFKGGHDWRVITLCACTLAAVSSAQLTANAENESPATNQGCHPHLGSLREELPSCDMHEQEYIEGTWRELSGQCKPQTLEDVEARQYKHEHYCNHFHHVCNEETDTCRKKAVNISSYEWLPAKCNLQAFDARELDRKLGKRKVLFVGDSIQLQQFFSFKKLMAAAIVGPSPPLWNKIHTSSGGRFEVIAAQFLVGMPCCNYFSNQSLSVLPDADWLQLAEQADIIIINTGHHWHRRDVEFQHYAASARNVMQTLKDNFKGSDVIFRTSTWGHHVCSDIKQPLPNAEAAMTPAWMVHDPYHWMQPIWRENIWTQLAGDVGLQSRFWYVNSSMTLLRGDGHMDWQKDLDGSPFNDCLHYCMPIVDHWNWILYNTLMSIANTQPQPEA